MLRQFSPRPIASRAYCLCSRSRSGSASPTFKVAVYPGDGIGLEVTQLAFKLVDELQTKSKKFKLDCTWFPWGCDYYDETGNVVPQDFLDILRPYDAIFLGAVGWPARIADHVTLKPLIDMRQGFDQYACVRPARTFPGVKTPLACTDPVELYCVRENSEGEYMDSGGRLFRGTPKEVATQTAVHTRAGVERILRFGLERAQARPRKRLTMATKSNAQKYAMVMWDEIFDELVTQYPDVAANREHIDALCMKFVQCPQEFDVVVASNLFGDILTDLSGAITGGLGLNPSANLNPERKFPSLFEPVHGSAPDIAGQNVANPTAAFLSVCMMLDWIGVDIGVSEAVRQAIDSTLEKGEATKDLGGSLSSEAYTNAVIGRLHL